LFKHVIIFNFSLMSQNVDENEEYEQSHILKPNSSLIIELDRYTQLKKNKNLLDADLDTDIEYSSIELINKNTKSNSFDSDQVKLDLALSLEVDSGEKYSIKK
jgi:hypothetical protein